MAAGWQRKARSEARASTCSEQPGLQMNKAFQPTAPKINNR